MATDRWCLTFWLTQLGFSIRPAKRVNHFFRGSINISQVFGVNQPGIHEVSSRMWVLFGLSGHFLTHPLKRVGHQKDIPPARSTMVLWLSMVGLLELQGLLP